jgi:coenzyme F420-reducing hydrogenase delta subunit
MKKEKGYIFKTEKGDAKVIDYICYVDSYKMDECYDIYLCKYNNSVAIVKVYCDSWDSSDIPIIDKIIEGIGVL